MSLRPNKLIIRFSGPAIFPKMLHITTGLAKQNVQCKIVNIFLPIKFNICFVCSKNVSLRWFF